MDKTRKKCNKLKENLKDIDRFEVVDLKGVSEEPKKVLKEVHHRQVDVVESLNTTLMQPTKHLEQDSKAFSRDSSETQLKVSVEDLPDNVLLHIFKWAGHRAIAEGVSCVCQRWRALACAPELWKDAEIYVSTMPHQREETLAGIRQLLIAPCVQDLNVKVMEPMPKFMFDALFGREYTARALLVGYRPAGLRQAMDVIRKHRDSVDELWLNGTCCPLTDQQCCEFWGIIDQLKLKVLGLYSWFFLTPYDFGDSTCWRNCLVTVPKPNTSSMDVLVEVQDPFGSGTRPPNRQLEKLILRWDYHDPNIKRQEALERTLGHRRLDVLSGTLRSLLRSHATTLREVELSASVAGENVTLLACCARLEKARVPLCREVHALEACWSLRALHLDCRERESSPSADIACAARFLRTSFLSARLQMLELMGVRGRCTALYAALGGLRSLATLQLEHCEGVRLSDVLMQLGGSLLELHVIKTPLHPADVHSITADMVRNLKVMRVTSHDAHVGGNMAIYDSLEQLQERCGKGKISLILEGFLCASCETTLQ